MNVLQVVDTRQSWGVQRQLWIDEHPLSYYVNLWLGGDTTEVAHLSTCWTDDLGSTGDVRFVKYVLGLDKATVPVLMDGVTMDFCSIVLAVEVEKLADKVVWRRIGWVDKKSYSQEEENLSGILHTQSYTKEDWQRYGDNVALAKVGSPEWLKWIADNWDEEVFRRNVNYVCSFYRDETDMHWFACCNWQFDRNQYEKQVQACFLSKTI
ncbi:MAG: hypothetical protein IKC47_05515 [Clostridia bacterium]|nr:hypothetical protein [Clostridia bacterium]